MTPFSPKAVTLDCANTLLQLRWTPDVAVATCAEHLGLNVSPSICSDFAYRFVGARPEYERASLKRDPETLHHFWLALHLEWLEANGMDSRLAEAFVATAERLTYTSDSIWFSLFVDTLPCLQRLKDAGYRVGVLSNWDSSLGRILGCLGIASYFDVIIASLEEGVEKPHPSLFQLAVDRLGVGMDECVHVGDNPVDDFDGAQGAGMRTLLLDRRAAASGQGVIRSLLELPEAFAWSV